MNAIHTPAPAADLGAVIAAQHIRDTAAFEAEAAAEDAADYIEREALSHNGVAQLLAKAASQAARIIARSAAQPTASFDDWQTALGDTYAAHVALEDDGHLTPEEAALAGIVCRQAAGLSQHRPAGTAAMAQLHVLLVDTARNARQLLMRQQSLALS